MKTIINNTKSIESMNSQPVYGAKYIVPDMDAMTVQELNEKYPDSRLLVFLREDYEKKMQYISSMMLVKGAVEDAVTLEEYGDDVQFLAANADFSIFRKDIPQDDIVSYISCSLYDKTVDFKESLTAFLEKLPKLQLRWYSRDAEYQDCFILADAVMSAPAIKVAAATVAKKKLSSWVNPARKPAFRR